MLSQWFVFGKSKNFTSSCRIQMPPTVPVYHNYGSWTNKKNHCSNSLFHAGVSKATACLKHSNLFKVTLPTQCRLPMTKETEICCLHHKQVIDCLDTNKQKFNYERFNCNNLNIRYWSWNYRGCWHQTCPPIDTCTGVYIYLIPIVKLLFYIDISRHYLTMSVLGNLRACCLP